MVKFLKIIPIAVKTGTVTIKYPYQEPLVTDSFRGAIEIDPNKCVGCGACMRICPPKALTLTTESNTMILRYFVGRCIFCGMCADTCPEKAIKITKEFELATGNIYDLYSDVEHEVKTCSICGKTFTSKKLSNKIASKVPDIPTETMDLCPDCRRKETLKKFIGVLEQ
ncbi:MAG: 4Fe-4S binding protein [Ignisphaera sp.]